MGRLIIAILLVVVLMAANTITGCTSSTEGIAEWQFEQGNHYGPIPLAEPGLYWQLKPALR